MTNNSATIRFIRISIYIIILAGLLIYGKISNPAITLEMCFQEPEKFDGSKLSLGTGITVKQVLPDGFIIGQFGRTIKVVGQTTGISPGEYISIIATFHQEGWLELIDFHVAKNRRYKILVSLLPAVLVIAFFCKSFIFDWQKFQFMEKC